MEELKELKAELSRAIDAASLLLDDRLYTLKSYFDLVTAIGCAKAVLAGETAREAMEEALDSIHEAVDELELREEASAEEETVPKKKNYTPLLVAGAFCGGLLLGKYVLKRGKKK